MSCEDVMTSMELVHAMIDSVSTSGFVLFANGSVERTNNVGEAFVQYPEQLIEYLRVRSKAPEVKSSEIFEGEFLRCISGTDFEEEANALGLQKVTLQFRGLKLSPHQTLFTIFEDRCDLWNEYVLLSFLASTVEKGLALFEEDPTTGTSITKYANDKYCELIGVSREYLMQSGTAAVRSRAHPDDRQIADLVARDAVIRETHCAWPSRFLTTDQQYKWMRFGLTAHKNPTSGNILLAAFIEDFQNMARIGGFDGTPDISIVESPRRGRRLVPSFHPPQDAPGEDGESEIDLGSVTTAVGSHDSAVASVESDLVCMQEDAKRFVFSLAENKSFFLHDIWLLREELILDLPSLFRKLFSRCFTEDVANVRMILQIFSQYIGSSSADWLESGGEVPSGMKIETIVYYVVPFLMRLVVLPIIQPEDRELVFTVLRDRLEDLSPLVGRKLVELFQVELALVIMSTDLTPLPMVDFVHSVVGRTSIHETEYIFNRALKIVLIQRYLDKFRETAALNSNADHHTALIRRQYPNIAVFDKLFNNI